MKVRHAKKERQLSSPKSKRKKHAVWAQPQLSITVNSVLPEHSSQKYADTVSNESDYNELCDTLPSMCHLKCIT